MGLGAVGHARENIQKRGQSLVSATELLEYDGEFADHQRLIVDVRGRGATLAEEIEQSLRIAVGKQRVLDPPRLGGIVQSARDDRLKAFRGMVVLALAQRQATQANQHLASGHRGVAAVAPTREHQQSTVGLLRALEVAALLGDLG